MVWVSSYGNGAQAPDASEFSGYAPIEAHNLLGQFGVRALLFLRKYEERNAEGLAPDTDDRLACAVWPLRGVQMTCHCLSLKFGEGRAAACYYTLSSLITGWLRALQASVSRVGPKERKIALCVQSPGVNDANRSASVAKSDAGYQWPPFGALSSRHFASSISCRVLDKLLYEHTMLNRIRDSIFGSDVPADKAGLNVQNEGKPSFELGDFAIDEYKSMKIIAIGAGMSGLLAGIRFRQYVENLDLTIYEKEDNIGGTWYVNKYPGIACDIPAHSFQYTFEHKSDWSALYSPGAEILGHMESIVSKYKLAPYIKLRHELTHARYDEATAKWHVRIKRPSANAPEEFEEFDDEADFLFMGVGILSRWTWPDIAGLKDFKGLLVHSSNWKLGGESWMEDVKDWSDKRVAVIGLGSAALQIVAALQDKVGRLSQYARGRTWVATEFARDALASLLSRDFDKDGNYTFTAEEKARLSDPVESSKFRKGLDHQLNGLHAINMRDSEQQKEAQRLFKAQMTDALKSKPEIAEKLIPEFSVSCRRITPAPGYLNALCRDHVDFITTPIKRITEQGIETADGSSLEHDIIICATGWDTSFRLPFPIIGRNGTDIRDKWSPYPKTYLSLCVDEFPNCFFSSGPNSCIGTSSFLPMIEHQVDYAVQVVRKLQRERLKSIEVKPEVVEEFDEIIESYFQKARNRCSLWYKAGNDEGRIIGLWPGSGLHHMRSLRYPRWEDYNYERADTTKNRLYWLGDGMTNNEKTLTGDRAWFIDPSYVDVPPGESSLLKCSGGQKDSPLSSSFISDPFIWKP
ncbi:hypothetical protein NM688_g3421 [Phlebia brevispora]|uniref:Uncharacterized protein n=1 Tax=Phlebia brevispora TaxID=194682 RepID=A0ACC1T5K5_9APHY|nr:hypothetical protein NM688_g3421 [Phlebia brevispora]